MISYTPQQIVRELDRHIIGQAEAKKAVAIALRNRWRRQQVPDDLRDEIVAKVPKNVVKRYERLRGSIPNVVLVIADANCTGCRMALPPQLYIELQRAEELHQCPHCQRMIIHKNVLDD